MSASHARRYSSLTQRFSSSIQNRFERRLISNRRLVWRFEWLTF